MFAIMGRVDVDLAWRWRWLWWPDRVFWRGNTGRYFAEIGLVVFDYVPHGHAAPFHEDLGDPADAIAGCEVRALHEVRAVQGDVDLE